MMWQVSNFTRTQIKAGLIREDEIAERWMLYVFGGLMQVTSIVGFLVNVKVLYGYCSKKMSSFEIMCLSKTLSNNVIIACYICYNAPVTIFYSNIFNGPTFLNILVNQSVSYGVYIIGPLTQFLISINRVLVMFFVKQSMSSNHQKLTLLILSTFWASSFLILAYGTLDDCSVIYVPSMLNWYTGGCDDVFGEIIAAFVVILAILSNICNVLVVIKLVTSVKSGITDTVSSKRRKAKSRKMFIQNCIQDWTFAVDSINSTYIDTLHHSIIFRFFLDIFSNLMTPVLDGFIMLIFTAEYRARSAGKAKQNKQGKKSTAVIVSSQNVTNGKRSSTNY